MKYLLFIPLLFSLLFAWPTGTTKTMRVIVNSGRVNETATNFVHQLNLSDSIVKVDSLIDSTKHVAVCLPDGSTLKPKNVIYVPGKKFLIYWDGAKHTNTNDTFYLCFGLNLTAVNSTATYSNSNEADRWCIDNFSGNTFYDYVGGYNGTGTSVDTIASKFGVGAFYNAATDNINVGNVTAIRSTSVFTYSSVINWTNFSATYTQMSVYKSVTECIYMWTNTTNLTVYIGDANYGRFTLSGNISVGTNYLISIVYNGSGSTNADKLKIYVNGVEKTLTFAGTIPGTIPAISSTPLYIGNTSASHRGVMDEIAIMSVALSGNAVLDRYRVLFEPSTFYTVGAITSVKKKSTRNNKPLIAVGVRF